MRKRITKLKELAKNICVAGTEVTGDTLAEVWDCILEHYDGGKLVINVKANGTTITSSDKTYNEILEAYNAGKTLIVNLHGSIYNLCFVGATYFRFSRMFVKTTYADISGLMVSNDNTWTYDVYEIFNNE